MRVLARENSYRTYVAKAPYTIKPYKHPKFKFVVRSKTNGRWVRKYCETLGEAKTYADQKTIELMNQGRDSVEFPTWPRVMAQLRFLAIKL